MAARTLQGSKKLGAKIRMRRDELGLTIEEAASKAGVGVKTWCRYEAGGSIRHDKVASICRTLNWRRFPDEEDEERFDLNDFMKRDVWPKALAAQLGDAAAVSFVIGSDILLDCIKEDLSELSGRPRGTHIGELGVSWLAGDLPEQFLMNYDYEFLYYLKTLVTRYRSLAGYGSDLVAHTVAEELVLYLIMEESEILMENVIDDMPPEKKEEFEYWDSWAYDLFDDMDIVTYLYDGQYLEEDDPYHFKNWKKRQFWCVGESAIPENEE